MDLLRTTFRKQVISKNADLSYYLSFFSGTILDYSITKLNIEYEVRAIQSKILRNLMEKAVNGAGSHS